MAETLTATEVAPVTPAPASPAVPAPGVTPAPVPSVPSDWRATLPDDLRADKSLEKFKGPAELARSYKHLEAFQGRSVVIPGADAKPEERAAFDAKINAARGVPDAPDKYEIPLPEGLTPDPAGMATWKSTFHRLGLTPAQVAGLTSEFFSSPAGNPQLGAERLKTEAVTTLRAEWGGAYDYNLRMAQEAARLADRQSGAGLLPLLDATGLGNHPAVVKHFRWLGKEFAEGGEILRDAGQAVMGPAEARTKIAEINANLAHPYWKQGPGHAEAVQEMNRLVELAREGDIR